MITKERVLSIITIVLFGVSFGLYLLSLFHFSSLFMSLPSIIYKAVFGAVDLIKIECALAGSIVLLVLAFIMKRKFLQVTGWLLIVFFGFLLVDDLLLFLYSMISSIETLEHYILSLPEPWDSIIWILLSLSILAILLLAMIMILVDFAKINRRGLVVLPVAAVVLVSISLLLTVIYVLNPALSTSWISELRWNLEVIGIMMLLPIAIVLYITTSKNMEAKNVAKTTPEQ